MQGCTGIPLLDLAAEVSGYNVLLHVAMFPISRKTTCLARQQLNSDFRITKHSALCGELEAEVKLI